MILYIAAAALLVLAMGTSALAQVSFQGTVISDETRSVNAPFGGLLDEVMLRKGGTCFFGTRYSTVTADRAPTDMFLSAVPQAMRENSSYEDFASAVRAKGIVFLPESVLRDLFRNRLDYVKLQERARAVKEERVWEKKLNSSVR